ncbi:MAG: hypothetical protein HZC12_00415 [Nitrospirae bacterium]|nr:hypothetical protein [Nitrospirota bacterium]
MRAEKLIHDWMVAYLREKLSRDYKEVSVNLEGALSGLGAKLILMVPRNSKTKVVELLWQKGLADKVAVGSYEIVINMP